MSAAISVTVASSAYLALDTPVSSALTHELTACSRSGRLIEDLEKVTTSIPVMGGWRRQVPMS